MKTIEELAKLSDEELRVMCAELCGWKKLAASDLSGRRELYGINPSPAPEDLGKMDLTPNYPADLNAMHEAVMSMEGPEGKDERHQYRGWLKAICGTANDAIDATARHRCIAFIAVKQQPVEVKGGGE